MVESLNMDVEIIACPIIRDNDGLALSSRNSYLNLDQRNQALSIYKGLSFMKQKYRSGIKDINKLKELGLEKIASNLDVQYLEFVDANTLECVNEANDNTLIAVGAYCGATRLIDNILI